MEIRFIGFGGAFDYEFGNSAAILEKDEYKILIDCGFLVYPMLRQQRITYDITHVLITHLHDDHCGSFSNLLFHRKLFHGSPPLKVLCPNHHFKKEMLHYLSFAMQEPERYAEFINLEDMGFIDFIDTTGKHVKGMSSFSYVFREGSQTLVYSGDLADPDYLFSNLIDRGVQGAMVFIDTSFQQNGAHGFYRDIQKYGDAFELYGYHHDPRQKPIDCNYPLVAEHESLLVGGQVLNIRV